MKRRKCEVPTRERARHRSGGRDRHDADAIEDWDTYTHTHTREERERYWSEHDEFSRFILCSEETHTHPERRSYISHPPCRVRMARSAKTIEVRVGCRRPRRFREARSTSTFSGSRSLRGGCLRLSHDSPANGNHSGDTHTWSEASRDAACQEPRCALNDTGTNSHKGRKRTDS
jgi:hypothetical protein